VVTFEGKQIGDGNPCFITFEAGPTHHGLESAKRLVGLAAEAGADAVKFQMVDAERLVADKAQEFTYKVLIDRATGEMEEISESLYELLCRRMLNPDEWKELKAHSDSLGLAFFASVNFEEDIEMLEALGCHSVKIASSDVNHLPLIRLAARTGMCIQLDTGNATIGEIENAIDVARGEGNENIIIHQCPSGYPARLESINLNIIPTLKRMFPYPVAYSDHTPGWEMDVAAVAVGANLVEKTITEDRTTRSVEHVFSLEPDDMAAFITTIRDVETAMGTNRRVLHTEERQNRITTRRSTYLKESAAKGQRLGDAAVDFRRPGDGVSPDIYELLVDRTFTQDLPAGHKLTLGDFT